MKQAHNYFEIENGPNLDFVGLISPSCKRENQYCSCVLISKSHILFANHCIRKCKDFHALFPNGQKFTVTDVRPVGEPDLAIGRIIGKCEIAHPSILKSPYREGERTIVAGWGDMQLHWGFSRLRKDPRLTQQGYIAWTENKIDPIVSKGDSGGAILICRNNQLQLIGIIIGHNGYLSTNNLGAHVSGINRTLPIKNRLNVKKSEFRQWIKLDKKLKRIRPAEGK